ADRVEVYSRSAAPGSPGYQWLSDGSGVFEIAEASGVRIGTKIIIHLKSDCKEFASEARVRDVVTKYSNFVSFPLYLNGRRMNTLQEPVQGQALHWVRPAQWWGRHAW
ncbi:TRAP1 isoform 13, partial [Pongo abelii]